MHTFVAISGRLHRMGGLADVLAWSRDVASRNQSRVVKVLKVRPRARGASARIVAEVTIKGVHYLSDGRRLPLRELRRRLKYG